MVLITEVENYNGQQNGKDRSCKTAIPLPAYTGKQSDSAHSRDASTPTFIVAHPHDHLVTGSAGCPSADEWLMKIKCAYTVELYSIIKKSQTLSFARKWIEM